MAAHRRAAAAVLAGVTKVPCVLRPNLALDGDAAGDRAAQAGHVGAMLAENLHRQGLSAAVEEARGVQAMLDLGVSLTTVPSRPGWAASGSPRPPAWPGWTARPPPRSPLPG